MLKTIPFFLPLAFILTACSILPNILSGPCAQDIVKSASLGAQALQDKDSSQKKLDTHQALDEATDAVIEGAEAAVGLKIPVSLDIWHDGDKKKD